MKKLLQISAFCFLLSAFPVCAQVRTPFIGWMTDLTGDNTNAVVTIQSWTNDISGVSTNLVLNFYRTYTPTAGLISGLLQPGRYKLTVAGLNRGALFDLPSSSSTQNLAQLSLIPAPVYMNFTLAQFSDVGTAAYSNTAAFVLSSAIGTAAYSNAAAFTTPPQATNAALYRMQLYSNFVQGSFTGDGQSLTNLQPGAFTSGTNGISETATLMSNFVNRSQSQTISGDKVWTGSNNHAGAVVISNLASLFHVGLIFSTNLNGIIGAISNGVWWSGRAHALLQTNGINYGNAFSSPGSGSFSEQFGNSAQATALASTALGYGATASGSQGTAVGTAATASGGTSIALGVTATASEPGTSALGNTATASATNATALGATATASHNNATAIGYGAASTAADQVMLGTASVSVRINNNGTVGGGFAVSGMQTNINATGTNSFSDLAFRRYANTSLVNGDNAAVLVGTNTFVQVSGPSAAFTIHGVNGSPNRDGHTVIILNKTGFNMTIAHESGIEPTATYRIVSLSGADRSTTANGAAILIYSASETRWQLLHLDP